MPNEQVVSSWDEIDDETPVVSSFDEIDTPVKKKDGTKPLTTTIVDSKSTQLKSNSPSSVLLSNSPSSVPDFTNIDITGGFGKSNFLPLTKQQIEAGKKAIGQGSNGPITTTVNKNTSLESERKSKVLKQITGKDISYDDVSALSSPTNQNYTEILAYQKEKPKTDNTFVNIKAVQDENIQKGIDGAKFLAERGFKVNNPQANIRLLETKNPILLKDAADKAVEFDDKRQIEAQNTSVPISERFSKPNADLPYRPFTDYVDVKELADADYNELFATGQKEADRETQLKYIQDRAKDNVFNEYQTEQSAIAYKQSALKKKYDESNENLIEKYGEDWLSNVKEIPQDDKDFNDIITAQNAMQDNFNISTNLIKNDKYKEVDAEIKKRAERQIEIDKDAKQDTWYKFTDEWNKLRNITDNVTLGFVNDLASLPRFISGLTGNNEFNWADKIADSTQRWTDSQLAYYNTPTDLQRENSQDYAEVDGYRVFLDSSGNVLSVRDDKNFIVNDESITKSITDKYNSDKTKYKTKVDWIDGEQILNQSSKVIGDMLVMMAEAGGTGAILKGTGKLSNSARLLSLAENAKLTTSIAIITQMQNELMNDAIDKGMSKSDAAKYAAISGAGVAAISLINPMEAKFLDNIKNVKSLAKEEVASFLTGNKTLSEISKNTVKNIIQNSVPEIAEEQFFEPILQNNINNAYKINISPDEKFDNTDILSKENLSQAVITVATTFLPSITEVAKGMSNNNAKLRILENPENWLAGIDKKKELGLIDSDTHTAEVSAMKSAKKKFDALKGEVPQNQRQKLSNLISEKVAIESKTTSAPELKSKYEQQLSNIDAKITALANGKNITDDTTQTEIVSSNAEAKDGSSTITNVKTEIANKISNGGIESLTPEEKDYYNTAKEDIDKLITTQPKTIEVQPQINELANQLFTKKNETKTTSTESSNTRETQDNSTGIQQTPTDNTGLGTTSAEKNVSNQKEVPTAEQVQEEVTPTTETNPNVEDKKADIERRKQEDTSVERGVLINFESGKTKEQLLDIVDKLKSGNITYDEVVKEFLNLPINTLEEIKKYFNDGTLSDKIQFGLDVKEISDSTPKKKNKKEILKQKQIALSEKQKAEDALKNSEFKIVKKKDTITGQITETKIKRNVEEKTKYEDFYKQQINVANEQIKKADAELKSLENTKGKLISIQQKPTKQVEYSVGYNPQETETAALTRITQGVADLPIEQQQAEIAKRAKEHAMEYQKYLDTNPISEQQKQLPRVAKFEQQTAKAMKDIIDNPEKWQSKTDKSFENGSRIDENGKAIPEQIYIDLKEKVKSLRKAGNLDEIAKINKSPKEYYDKNFGTQNSENNTKFENNGKIEQKQNRTIQQSPTDSKEKKPSKRGKTKLKDRKIPKSHKKALSADVSDLKTYVMQAFIGGAKLSPSAIEELYRGAKSEVNARRGFGGYVQNNGLSLNDMAHSIWENMESDLGYEMGDSQKVANAIEEVVNTHNRINQMVDEINSTNTMEQYNDAIYENNKDATPSEIDESINFVEDLTEEEIEHFLKANDAILEQQINDYLKENRNIESINSELKFTQNELSLLENKLSKQQEQLSKNLKENQVDIFGNNKPQSLFNDKADQQKIVDETKKEIDIKRKEVKTLEDDLQRLKDEENQYDIPFQIIGEKGAAKLDNAVTIMEDLKTAKKMDADGKDPQTIKNATAWEKGGDGKWRYEINDFQFSDVDKVLDAMLSKENKTFLAKEILKDTELEKIYDNYNDLKIKFDANEQRINISANYDKATNTITVYTNNFQKDKSGKQLEDIKRETNNLGGVRRKIIHEIQHFTQENEGFARGGNPGLFENKEFTKDEEFLLEEFVTSGLSSEDYLKKPEVKFIIDTYGLTNVKEIISNGNKAEIDATLKDNSLDKFEKYKRIAGEVEARNAEARTNLTLEQRAKILLSDTEDVLEKDKIYLKNEVNNGISESAAESQPDRFKTISKKSFDNLISTLKKAFPNIKVEFFDSKNFEEAKKELENNKVYVLDISNNDGTIYGFKTPDGKVFINTDNLNANTPIHEFGHVWEQMFPIEFAKGIVLLKNSEIGRKFIADTKNNPAYKNRSQQQIEAEALVKAIGDKGETIFNSNPTFLRMFTNWLKDFFAKVGDKIGQITGVKSLQFTPDTKFNNFVKSVVGDLLGGKELGKISKQNGDVQFQIDNKLKDFVEQSKASGMTLEQTLNYLNSNNFDYKEKDIKDTWNYYNENKKDEISKIKNTDTVSVIGNLYDIAENYKPNGDYDAELRDDFIKEVKSNKEISYLFNNKQLEKIYSGEKLSTADNIIIDTKKKIADLKKNYKDKTQDVKQQQRDIESNINELLKDADFKQKLTPAQIKAISKRAMRAVRMMSTNEASKLQDYIDNVVKDQNYAVSITEARNLQKRIMKSLNATKSNVVAGAKGTLYDIASLKPEEVKDIYKHIEMLKNAVQYISLSPKIDNNIGQVTNDTYKSSYVDLQSYTNEQRDFIIKTKDEFLKQEYGTQYDSIKEDVAKELYDKTIADLTKEELDDVIDNIDEDMIIGSQNAATPTKKQTISEDDLKTTVSAKIDATPNVSEFEDNGVTVSEKEKSILYALKKIDISKLSKKDLIQLNKVLENINTNYDFSGSGKIRQIQRLQENIPLLAEIKKQIGKFNNIKGLIPKALDLIGFGKSREYNANLPALATYLARGEKFGAEVQRLFALTDLTKNFSQTELSDKARRIEINSIIGKDKEITNPLNQARMYTYSIAVQNKGGNLKDIQASFEWAKQRLQSNIDNIKKNGSAYEKEVELPAWEQAYSELIENSNNAEEVRTKTEAINGKIIPIVESLTAMHDKLKNDFKESSLINDNKGFGDEINNYNHIKVTPLQGKSDSVEDSGNSVPTGLKSKDTKSKYKRNESPILSDSRKLSINFINEQIKNMRDVDFESKTKEHVRYIDAMLENKEVAEIIGEENIALLKAHITTMYQTMQGAQTKGDYFDSAAKAIGFLTKAGSTIALASPLQYVKQNTVRISTLVNNPIMFFKSMNAMLDSNNKDAINTLLNQYTIGSRASTDAGTVIPRNEIDNFLRSDSGKKLVNFANSTGEKFESVREYMIGALKNADVNAAKQAWVAFYMESLDKQGIDTKNIDWEKEAESPNEKAAAYAETKQQTLQGANIGATMGKVLLEAQQSNFKRMIYNILYPFASFGTNQKIRMTNNVQNMVSGADKGAATKDFFAHLSEIAAYQGVKILIGSFLYSALDEIIFDALGIPHQSDDEEKRKKKIAKKITTGVIDDVIFQGMTPSVVGDYLKTNILNKQYQNLTGEKDLFYDASKYNAGDNTKFDIILGSGAGVYINSILNTVKDSKAAITGVAKGENTYNNFDTDGLGTLKSYKGEYNLNDKEQRAIAVVAIIDFLQTSGVSTQYTNSLINKIKIEIKKANKEDIKDSANEHDTFKNK